MQLYDVARARPVEQIVDVLRDVRHLGVLSQGRMGGVGLSLADGAAAVGVPVDHEFRIASKAFGGGQLHRVELRPEPAGVGIAERGDA